MTCSGQKGGAIFIVDDDPAVLDALSALFRLEGYDVGAFSDGTSFLAATKTEKPRCVLLDVNMPGRTGLDILKELNAQQYPSPIIIMSGVGDIPMAVDAIRNGALDFIEKPFDAASVVARVGEACLAWKERFEKTEETRRSQDFPGHEQLTPREHEVLTEIAAGASNKEVGRVLGISPRTVEVHRARIMEKLGARNAADLVRIVLGHKRGA